ncbi:MULTISPECIES: hypothetical protein [Streptomyces]|uniref:Amidohydrolase n=1 Tax=Streptomyces eurythermus TaxID=42237 RepID=A0ABW6YQ50_9ACTN|nr:MULTISPECIES: hypothetical protein [Streptomyces]QIS74628.1 hypothetical protein HB370_35420 [Streptomyces sp. DSM 40868]
MPTLFRERIVIPATAPAAAAAGAGQAPAHASCFDRATRPYTSVVDSHLHYRPFGGKAIPFEELNTYLRKSGVHYVNDFVASSDKSYAVYRKELEVTSRINKALGGRAFRGIALGENYFRLLGLNTTAPRIRAQK